MKIAITGKGGVGKTTLSAVLCYLFKEEGKKVIAVDADPDANLAGALGVPRDKVSSIKPIAELKDLIAERTGAMPGQMGGVFKLNPKVDDIPEEIGYRIGGEGNSRDGIVLLTIGSSKEAASGCYCPENVFLRRLLKHLIVERDEVVIVDMEAGIEHLTRGTAEGVDAFIVVVEPGSRSIQTAMTVKEMAKGLGIKRVFVVGNKVRGEEDRDFIKNNVTSMELLGFISFNHEIMEADIKGISPYHYSSRARDEIKSIKENLLNKIAGSV